MHRRRHRGRWRRDIAKLLLCAAVVGWTPILAIMTAFLLSPAVTAFSFRRGWTTTQISDVTIGVNPFGWLVVTPALVLCGLVAVVIALPAARFAQRRPDWHRAVRGLFMSTMLGLVPWFLLIIVAESALILYDGSDTITGMMMIAYLLVGPSISVIVYRLSRGAWRRWQLHRNLGHIPRNPCPSCGYDLRMAHSCCPECGHSLSAES